MRTIESSPVSRKALPSQRAPLKTRNPDLEKISSLKVMTKDMVNGMDGGMSCKKKCFIHESPYLCRLEKQPLFEETYVKLIKRGSRSTLRLNKRK